MSHNFQWFSSYTPLPSATSWPITAIVGHQCYVAGTGTIKLLVQLPHKVEIVFLENVLYVPGLKCNLFSTTLMATEHYIHFIGTQTHCHFVKDDEILFTGRLVHDMYLLDFTVLLPPAQGFYTAAYGNIPLKEEQQTLQIWHHRLGHLHFDMIKKMVNTGAVTGISLTTTAPQGICSACQFGKLKQQSFLENHFRTYASHPGDLVHGDICGPMSQPSKGGSVYFVLFQDDSTGYIFVLCITRKSEALTCFQKVFKTILRDTSRTISTLRTDRGGGFCSQAFSAYLSDNHIRRELTTSYTPEQNVVVERANRTIMEGVRSSLYYSQLPMTFWAEAVVYIVYTLNRTCSRVHGTHTPFELYTGLKPSLSHLRPFGCPVFIHIPDHLRKKLDVKCSEGIFVGYSEESKAYRVWDLINVKWSLPGILSLMNQHFSKYTHLQRCPLSLLLHHPKFLFQTSLLPLTILIFLPSHLLILLLLTIPKMTTESSLSKSLFIQLMHLHNINLPLIHPLFKQAPHSPLLPMHQ